MNLTKKERVMLVACSMLFVTILTSIVGANYYIADIYHYVPQTVYSTGEQILFKGYLQEANYSNNGTLVSSSIAATGRTVNITIRSKGNGTYISNYTLTTDSTGSYYSNSSYYSNGTKITAPGAEGDYILRAQYIDANSTTWYSEVEIRAINNTVDTIKVRPDKSNYNPSETITITSEAMNTLNDKVNYISNVTFNGTLRNNTKGIIQSFNCITESNGKCTNTITAPSSYGTYSLELNGYKAYSSFSIVPFSASAYMKDELGKSYKNTYALGEQASVEVVVIDNTTTSNYNFSGYIADSSGNVIQSISGTQLTSNNSYTNKFTFTINSISYKYGTYYANVIVVKSGDGNQTLKASFEVKDWKVTFNKKSSASGFEYDYSVFPNTTIKFETYPRYRSNASIIQGINQSAFSINLTDKLNNNLATANILWNATCGSEGCYEFNITSPTNTGSYDLELTLSYSGDTQKFQQKIEVMDKVLGAQSTDSEGNVKELFGNSEQAYISISSYNKTATQVNLSQIEIFMVTYMNGTTMNYTNTSNFDMVNSTNNILEWAVNLTTQRIKMDVPRYGGTYEIYIYGENRTVAGISRIVVNPYDVCLSAKNTPGTVSSANGQYYVWQFKNTDTVYFEMKVIQANNPLGKAGVSNFSGNGSNNGMGSACSINTQTQQTINNATINIVSVKNTQNGGTYSINGTSSVCTATDTSGGYTCTVEPANKWDGGTYSVEMMITGPDGQTQDIVYGFFEARAFYLYGWSQTWQNRPSSNITLTVQMYEAGRNWWGAYGSGGLSGTVSVEKIEYQGRDGEWVWPPVSYSYNTSAINSTTITTGQGTITLPVQYAPGGNWKTGYYRVVLKGVDADGNTDYGYAWMSIKRWNVYGSPIECGASSCNYKSYFNSKENITLYIQVSNAGDYSYYYSGGENLGGNISISVKKIQDCRTWPCKDLNSSEYISSTVIVNQSNNWYWNANASQGNYLLRINKTGSTNSWNTGYYSVVLDINGSETGNAWFNTIAFYVDSRPTNSSGDTTSWHYSIKNNEPKYYNITTIKSYKGWGSSYNASDYINTTITRLTLRAWDETTYQTKEYNYPTDLNITPTRINGTEKINITYNNGSWPSGNYWGEIILNNSDGETSTGWLSFDVRPFRVSMSINNYEVSTRTCINGTMSVYEPSWSSNKLLNSNYTISGVYENIWDGMSQTTVTYANYTNTTFVNETTITICPNQETAKWSSGSWGGYHYLTIVVNDTNNNLTQNAWVSFRTVPFSVTWGTVTGGSSKKSTENINVTASIKVSTTNTESATGNLSKIYQWRSSTYGSLKEEYNYTVWSNENASTCNSWQTSNQCKVNGTHTITVYAPSTGWTVGSNYLYAEWNEVNDRTSIVQDWYGVYINGMESYNGYFSNYDVNGGWKYQFAPTDNLTITLLIRNLSYGNVPVNITNVEYAVPSSTCWDEWCRSYTTASSWSINGGGIQTATNGSVITIVKPSTTWALGEYYIKVTVSGSGGTATIKNGRVSVRDMTAPNVTINAPTINQTINNATFSLTATTTETANCNIYMISYNHFNSWYCSSSNSTNSTNTALTDSCNTTKYGFNGSDYYYDYVSKDYHSVVSGQNYTQWYQSASSGMTTDSTTHTYTFNTTNKVTNAALTSQDYGIMMWCYDTDWNYGTGYSTIKINITG
ncbi:hypothetical protein COU61_03370 [Candidatus Pacearchaeota archaeon CG10_big_fil_rev_8_21_14_0_10_35_13]|nr:MAG: hypothetical protein COU61_03370 [Candidatus Pacearchaeota archaeon CG10_big_fil_rev_8_21_14_0_10_35_13]